MRREESLSRASREKRKNWRLAGTIGILRLVLACATALAVSAQEASIDIATAVRGLEHEWFQAKARNDNGALDMIFDNDLVYIEYGRLITKGDYLLRVKSPKAQLPRIVMETSTVHTFGSSAIVVGSYRESGVNQGKAFVKRWRYLDTWVYKMGRWVLVEAAATPISK